MTIPRSDRVSTENGWKCVPLEKISCVKLNRFRLKRLIPIAHDLDLTYKTPVQVADLLEHILIQDLSWYMRNDQQINFIVINKQGNSL